MQLARPEWARYSVSPSGLSSKAGSRDPAYNCMWIRESDPTIKDFKNLN